MNALDFMKFLNTRGRTVSDYRIFVVDAAMSPGHSVNAYPILHVTADGQCNELLLELRFPDDPERGPVLETIGQLCEALLPLLSDHPDYAVEATVILRVGDFGRLDMPIVGINGNDNAKMVLLLAQGVTYLEEFTGS